MLSLFAHYPVAALFAVPLIAGAFALAPYLMLKLQDVLLSHAVRHGREQAYQETRSAHYGTLTGRDQ